MSIVAYSYFVPIFSFLDHKQCLVYFGLVYFKPILGSCIFCSVTL